MKNIPFSFYDFFGYLAPGFLTLAVIDLVFLNKQLYKQDKSVVAFWVILVGGAYLIGQVLAFFSYLVYERLIMKKWLKKPTTNLFLKIVFEKRTNIRSDISIQFGLLCQQHRAKGKHS